LQFEPIIQKEQRHSRFLLGLAYCVIHASGLFAFLTFGMATNGLEFFYFYPRDAETILQPSTLHTMMWLGTAAFSIFSLIVLRRFRAEAAQEKMSGLSFLTVIRVASISFALPIVSGFPDLVPFWWIGAAALTLCWLGLGSGIASIFGNQRQLVKSFLASLLGIAAIVEIWSLGHWLYEGVAPSVTFGSVGSDLEMNLAYANYWLFPAVFTAAWLSPIWAYVVCWGYFLEPLVGAGVFYVAAVSLVLSNIGRRRASVQTVFATTDPIHLRLLPQPCPAEPVPVDAVSAHLSGGLQRSSFANSHTSRGVEISVAWPFCYEALEVSKPEEFVYVPALASMLIVLKVILDVASGCWSCEGYVPSISSARLLSLKGVSGGVSLKGGIIGLVGPEQDLSLGFP
jgi:hypothetical protein